MKTYMYYTLLLVTAVIGFDMAYDYARWHTQPEPMMSIIVIVNAIILANWKILNKLNNLKGG